MGEAVGPAEVDEDAEVADRGDLAAPDFALGELAQQALLLLSAPFLHGGALGEDGAVAAAVDLDHLHAQHPADLVGERVGAVAAGLGAHHLRHRDERVDALDVGEQAALVEAGDLRLEDLAAFEALLQDPPALFAARAVDRELDLAVLGLRLLHVGEHLLADAEPGERVGAERVHLLDGHDALGLGADVDEVDEDAVALDAHHGAFDHFAAAQLARFGRLAGVEQRAHVEDLFLGSGCGCWRRFGLGRWCGFGHCCGSAGRRLGLLRGVGVRQGLFGPPVLGWPPAARCGTADSRVIISRAPVALCLGAVPVLPRGRPGAASGPSRCCLGAASVRTAPDAERAGSVWAGSHESWQWPIFRTRLPGEYRQRCGVSLPCSGWERVVPPRSNHQDRQVWRRAWWRASGGAPRGRGQQHGRSGCCARVIGLVAGEGFEPPTFGL